MDEAQKVQRALQLIANISIDKASQVLSKMIKAGAKIELERVYVIDVSKATEAIIKDEPGDVVGAFVDLIGDMPFKFLFYVPAKDCMILTDMILSKELGATNKFDIYVTSCVQELGNILASSISNVFASDFRIAMRPSPPKIVHDYASTVFEEYIMEAAAEQSEILIIESVFRVVRVNIKCRMLLLPTGDTQRTLSSIIATAS